MSLAPLLDAAPAIPLHAFAAMAAFALGLVQFAAPKGTLPHRTSAGSGWLLMAVVAISFVLDPQIRAGRAVEPDPSAVDLHAGHAAARRVGGRTATVADQPDHDLTFRGALVVAGTVHLLPGRIMHAVVFGP